MVAPGTSSVSVFMGDPFSISCPLDRHRRRISSRRDARPSTLAKIVDDDLG
jgi:hypothetical protein